MSKKAKARKYKKPAAQPLDEKQLDGVNGGAGSRDKYCITGYGATDVCNQGQTATESFIDGGAEKSIRP